MDAGTGADAGVDASESEADGGDGGALPNVNPYGVAYPTGDIGTTARRGNTAGQRIRNFSFAGYRDAAARGTITNVSMVDYFDPQQKLSPPVKLIHLTAASRWDTYSNSAATQATPLIDSLRADGVVWITVLVEGTSAGVASTMADLDAFATAHPLKAPMVLDPGASALGVFFDQAALPWNAWIDARSMEILSAAGGSVGDISREASTQLSAWETRPLKP